jgi:uncharacterized protein YndB with AHSA1/START domain
MQTITDPTAEATTWVAAPPEQVWSLVSDVTRTGDWSPVCWKVEWLDPDGEPRVGARFRGHNKLNGVRWSRDCEVTVAEPARRFGFSTEFKTRESTRWLYTLVAEDGGTRVTESYQVISIPTWVRMMRKLPGAMAKTERDLRWNMEQSLARLKERAEADS